MPSKACRLLASCVVVAACSGSSTQSSYPTKPVRLLVPFNVGGVADITARVLAETMSKSLGQQLVVDNRPSAGGIIASDAVAKADPDGYTLLFMTNGNAVSASLFKSLPYDTVNDFAPVSTVGFFDLVVLAGADSRFGSLKDLIEFAKANPGKLNVGTINIGSTQHLAAELFKSMAGVDVQIVPFKGTPAVVMGLRANDVQLAFEILGPVLAQIKSGAVKPLAITADRRFAGLPQVPTAAESGLAGYQASSWNGVAAPAKTPPAIVARLNKEINAAVASAEVKQRLQDLGVEARAGTADEMRKLLLSEIAKWRDVIERAKIEKQ